MNDVADTVLIINLDRSATRMQAAHQEMMRHGVRYERLPAVDGKALTAAQITKLATEACASFCTPSTVGCFLSHMKAWQYVVDNGLDRAIILEDDVHVVDNYEGPLRAACADLPHDFDILFLACFTCLSQQPLDKLMQKLAGTRRETLIISEHLVRPAQTLGTHAYMISAKGARAALDRLPRPSFHLDWALSSLVDELQVYAVRPGIAFQTNAPSTIGAAHPHLLNAIASKIPYSSEEDDVRTWAWTMSEPVCTLGHRFFIVDGWLILSVLLALIAPRTFAVLFVLEVLISLALTQSLPAYFIVVGLVLAASHRYRPMFGGSSGTHK